MNDKRHDARLRRGRRLWDLACVTYYGAIDRLNAPLREMAVKHLELRPGQAVLDIGCASGATLVALRAAVGSEGRVVGVDFSPRMVARARKLVAEHSWTNVEVREADASRTPHGTAEFDAVVAMAAFSAMPDVESAVDLAHDALRPGGRLFLFDIRLPGTKITTRIQRRVYSALAGFTGADVLVHLRRSFAEVEPVLPGTGDSTPITIMLATKAVQRIPARS